MEKKARTRIDLNEVLIRTVQLLVRHQPQNLTYSKISRLIEVPRSTLYYYFGNKVTDMLEEAARFAMKRFVIFDKIDDYQSYKNWKDYQASRLHLAMERVELFPWSPRLYFRYRDDQGSLGEIVRKVEQDYLKKMRESWKHFHGSTGDYAIENQKIVAAIKLGFLWGYAIDFKGMDDKTKADFDSKKLCNKLCTIIEQLLDTK